MKRRHLMKEYGFTLIEMTLVAVVVSMFLVMGMNYMQQRTRAIAIDKASAQIQQILNAGLSFYVNNGTWPANLAALQADGYLPTSTTALASPWATPYSVSSANAGAVLTVTMSLPSGLNNHKAIGTMLAGKLPFGVSTTVGLVTSVAASVNVPGQNLNNAAAVNFAGLYHNGACVPVPDCPIDSTGTPMTPQILVVPASVSGMNDAGSTNVYPISSFTAYATNPSATPSNCTAAVDPACSGGNTNGLYWRVCLQVVTSVGLVEWSTAAPTPTAQYATVMAITRCAINNEPSGSSFSVYGP